MVKDQGKSSSDTFLTKRLNKYDSWLSDKRISHSSKVITVSESFDAKQWVIPTEQASRILRNAHSLAVQNCECRAHYKRCNNPLEVCLLLDEVAEIKVKRNQARSVNLEEAVQILRKANENGLIHLSFLRWSPVHPTDGSAATPALLLRTAFFTRASLGHSP